jgi:hypothetical protein
MRFAQSSFFAKAVFAAVGLLSLLPGPAAAQEATGKFKLTHPVWWGSAVLAAGEYTYKLEHQVSAMLVVRAADGQRGFMVLAQSISGFDPNQLDHLLLLQGEGGEWFVSSMSIASAGETLNFTAPTTHAVMARAATHDKLASIAKP